ncbi:hypothetical protein [Nannocystis pusilla]|uniref:Uncharacterized protein n=1 Tax=Nannocystis pusilla TaxID=889268 RepID=A0ABS7TK99_9BACT|nr:hypothetical protein [Nannocystis pusilla]MBZ5708658.1 hypothetical protein [Nannocystis pusilla]
MSRNAHQPGRAPSAELLRLAEQGARNIQAADRTQIARADRHMRVALGAHYGSLRQRLFFVPLVVGAGFVAATAAGFLPVDWLGAGMAPMMFGVFGAAFIEPVAGDGRIAGEREWLATRPFPVTGYFEALQHPPTSGALLLTRVRFAGEVPPPDLVQGVLGVIDANPVVRPEGGQIYLLQSGLISGATGIRINKRPVYRNHRIVPYVHGLVDNVLAPLHATYPIDQVELTRAA